MSRYIARRLLLLIPAWVAVALLTFLIMYLVPGDPLVTILGPQASPETRGLMLVQLGLNKPFLPRFIGWFGAAVHGDLGSSIFLGRPVTTAILERASVTLSLGGIALLITISLGLTFGILSALRPNSMLDTIVMVVSLAGLSTPEFLLGLGLIFTLGVWREWFPIGGYVTFAESPFRWFWHLLLPSFTLGFINSAIVSRMTRATMIKTLQSDYVRTARSKGLPERIVLLKHALRVALIPTLTVAGFAAILVVAGAFITEIVFTLPGMGNLAVSAVLHRDYPLVQGIMLVIATGILLLNLLIDITYVLADPRIRYE